MSDPNVRLSATFWKLGAEVWSEAKCGMMMLPPDSPAIVDIPPQALHTDPELDLWVTELRRKPPGPRLSAEVDDKAKTANVGGIPADYNGVKMVQAAVHNGPKRCSRGALMPYLLRRELVTLCSPHSTPSISAMMIGSADTPFRGTSAMVFPSHLA